MDIDTAFEQIRDLWPAPGEQPSPALLNALETTLKLFPDCAEAWCAQGDIYQLWDRDPPWTVDDYLECYRRALECNASCAEAYQEIGYLEDVYREQFEVASQYFVKAIELGAGLASYLGLARTLAESNRVEQAIATLSPEHCPFSDAAEVATLREEIATGKWSMDT